MADRGRTSWLGILTAGLNGIGTALILGLLVLLNADIGARAVIDQPIRGVTEIVALAFVAIVYLQLPHALRTGRLTVADTLFGRFERARPRAAAAVKAVYNLIGASLFGILLAASLPLFERAWTRNLFIGMEGSFTAPTWPVKLVILIGATAMIIQFLALAWNEARRAMGRADTGPGPEPGT